MEIIKNGYSIFPQKPTLETFKYVFSDRGKLISSSFMLSIETTLLGTLLACIITVSFAYTVSQPDFRGASFLSFFAYFTMLFSGGMLAWYIVCTRYLKLGNSMIGLILPSAFNVFNMYLMRNYFKSIPHELKESASIDGAGTFRIFFTIMLPLAKVGIVTIALFYGINYWNDFYLCLMLMTKEKWYTMQYQLYRLMSNVSFLVSSSKAVQFSGQIQIPTETVRMVMAVIAIGPIIIVYPFIQKYFVKGVIIGALKG